MINSAEALVKVRQFANRLELESASGFKNNGKAQATFDQLVHWVNILDHAIYRETEGIEK